MPGLASRSDSERVIIQTGDPPRAGVVAHGGGDLRHRGAVEHVREAREPDGIEPLADVGGHAHRGALRVAARHRAPPIRRSASSTAAVTSAGTGP
jgi:hypothetical protein